MISAGTSYSSAYFLICSIFGEIFPVSCALTVAGDIFKIPATSFCVNFALTLQAARLHFLSVIFLAPLKNGLLG